MTAALWTKVFGFALKFVGFLLFKRGEHVEAKKDFLAFAQAMERYGLAPKKLHQSYTKQMTDLQERIRAKKIAAQKET